MHYLFLILAILCEVFATSALKAADGFKAFGPSCVVFIGYSAAFYFLSLTLRVVPVAIAYAIWSGIGQVLIMVIAWVLYGQRLDMPALMGIGMILGGVLMLTLWSTAAPR